MVVLDLDQHVFKSPEGKIASITAPRSGSFGFVGRHLREIHAAHWFATISIRSYLVRQVQVDIAQVEDFVAGCSLLEFNLDQCLKTITRSNSLPVC